MGGVSVSLSPVALLEFAHEKIKFRAVPSPSALHAATQQLLGASSPSSQVACSMNKVGILVVIFAAFAAVLLNQGQFGMLDLFKGSSQAAKDRSRIGKYDKAYDVEGNLSHNDQEYTNLYYDLATDFYEYGWGQSFHFGTRYEGESFQQHIERHEHFLASKLGIAEGMKVLDMGMGVGGPLRNIVRFTNADVTGVTINHHQVHTRARAWACRFGSRVR